jgi:thiosulfate/3-mercaptopyruvate sulfurtransferase
MFTSIISPQLLEANLSNPQWKILDCRFYLADPEQAESEYLESHLPGAVYAHLDRDLCAPVVPGVTGRHPLPDVSKLAGFFGRCGIGPGSQVVVYDAQGGALAAARAWWLLRWLGFDAVAVLNGGWPYWVKEGMPVRKGVESTETALFSARLRPDLLVDSKQVETLILGTDFRLLDSRSADRFRGENETLDPVAGHIPGAISVPYAENLNQDGTLLSPDRLRNRFSSILGDIPASQAVVYCGSGVTAILNILAMEIAGLGTARLYPGSWSEWITNSGRPVSR